MGMNKTYKRNLLTRAQLHEMSCVWEDNAHLWIWKLRRNEQLSKPELRVRAANQAKVISRIFAYKQYKWVLEYMLELLGHTEGHKAWKVYRDNGLHDRLVITLYNYIDALDSLPKFIM